MFYDHVFTPDEKQQVLALAEIHFLIRYEIPAFLAQSKHAMPIRHAVTSRPFGNARRSGMVTTTLVPRVHMREVNRLLRDCRDNAYSVAARNLGRLFELGLGVPKQPDIAAYLAAYSPEADPKGIGLKYIRKLVADYHRKYRRSMAGSRWCMPAAYTANMLHMRNFIHLKENGYKKSVAVPDGIPVVLIYNNTSFQDAKFTLCDAFMISPTGFAVPMANALMRPEFRAVPKVFTSKALRGKGAYSMVMGMLYWPKEDPKDKLREIFDLDDSGYVSLLDQEQYADRRSPEYSEVLRQRDELNSQRHKWAAVIEKLGTGRTLTPEQRKQLQTAQDYISKRAAFGKEIDDTERDENRRAASKFAIGTAKFAAVDCGMIVDRTHYSAVSTALDKVQVVLAKWGFPTVDSVNASLKKSNLTFKTSGASRVWSL